MSDETVDMEISMFGDFTPPSPEEIAQQRLEQRRYSALSFALSLSKDGTQSADELIANASVIENYLTVA